MVHIKKAVFPVGGLGTRFLPATKAMPKEMLPLVDKPLIQYAVEEAIAAGIEEFIFITGRGKTAIEDHFDISHELEDMLRKNGRFEILELMNQTLLPPGQVAYIRQQAPLGLGHAVWCARHLVQDEPFAVLLADDFLISRPGCMQQMVANYTHGAMASVMYVPTEKLDRYGVIGIKDSSRGSVWGVETIIEKPACAQAPSNHAVIGRYILPGYIFDILSAIKADDSGEIQLTDALLVMAEQQQLFAMNYSGERFDCGAKDEWIMAQLSVALSRPDLSDTVRSYIKQLLVAEEEPALI